MTLKTCTVTVKTCAVALITAQDIQFESGKASIWPKNFAENRNSEHCSSGFQRLWGLNILNSTEAITTYLA